MTEFQGVRQREAEPWHLPPEFEAHAVYQRNWRVRAEQGRRVIKGKGNPFVLVEQGHIRNYVNPTQTDVATTNMRIFQHIFKKVTGKHTHQGGYSLFIVEGGGYTIVDGVRYNWKPGDLVLLPIKKGGCEHQHFNSEPDRPSRWLALNPRPLHECLGAYTHQKEFCEDWKQAHGDGVVQGSTVWLRDMQEQTQPKTQKAAAGIGAFTPLKITPKTGRAKTRWDELIELRDQQREQLKHSRVVVHFDELPWEINPQGKMKWYLHPGIKDTAHHESIIYMQEIPPGSRSGKLIHQGGTAFYVWKGKGYSIINDERFDWEEEDLILLPVSIRWDEGVTYQHFNADPKEPALLLASAPNVWDSMGVDLGIGLEQLETCPEYIGK